jgi:hypothetical protein
MHEAMALPRVLSLPPNLPELLPTFALVVVSHELTCSGFLATCTITRQAPLMRR